ncbi:tRNA-uridine aminocarboxypropyltransferase [Opacimonas viscosa]|uniref:tRNA-uridine aminocarboxypropyltransferase n=1 Tax=Opacimonas viscosa TaxID=2961944 RepID=A0AA41X2J3_9ALTE|nr:tRNA-uridine aminocarboxypropyltransferase [Opacimonas viscosa]MCP3428702.1 DTW domain-containing protein [Opacimonas viscosa]
MSLTKRVVCHKCLYPSSTCLCDYVEPFSTPVNIVVLQDPSESKHAKNTVRLLKLCLRNIVVHITDGSFTPLSALNKNNTLVLYPSSTALSMEALIEQSSLSETKAKCAIDLATIKNVVILDGSWSKTHKIWSTQTWLHEIPQITFAELPESQYRIRKANRKNSLSSLEACAHVLDKLYKVNVTPLYNLLNALQDRWEAHKVFSSTNNS